MPRGHAKVSPVSPRGGGRSCHPPRVAREPREKRGKPRKTVEKWWKRRFLAHFWAGPLPALGAALSHPRSPPLVPPRSPRPALSHQPVWPPPRGAFQRLPSPNCPLGDTPGAGGDTPRWHRTAPPPHPEPPRCHRPAGDSRGGPCLSPGCDSPGAVALPPVPLSPPLQQGHAGGSRPPPGSPGPSVLSPQGSPPSFWGGFGAGKGQKYPPNSLKTEKSPQNIRS